VDAADDPWPRVGDRVGSHVLGPRLACDEWFRVHRADDDHVTVRLFTPRPGTGERYAAHAAHAVVVVRALEHPAILPALAGGLHRPSNDYRSPPDRESIGWLATRTADGVPLDEWLVSQPFPEVLAVLHEVASALAAVEATDVICDGLLPDDIFIGADGRVLVDVACGATIRRALYNAVIREDVVVGARELRLMAPEQFQNPYNQSTSHRTTQHTFCAIAWRALLARWPFGDRNPVEYLAAVRQGHLERRRSAVPRKIRDALARGLAPDPAARWPSMAALQAALVPPRGPLTRLLGR